MTKEIYGQMSAKFWYHGNLWLNDPDFLIVMGDKQLKPEAKGRKNYQLGEKGKPRAYEGYTPEKAKTWATMIVISGGVVIWSDNPPDINGSGLKIVETALEHGGGNSGVPLDLETEQYPRKWVRREGDRVYVAAINVEAGPITVTIGSNEVPELKNAKSASDIFSGERHAVQNENIELAVPPFSSHCVLLD